MHDDRALGAAPSQTVLVCIAGRVQGVGFRDWTRRQAVKLALTGWVRNRADGTVEALFHGPHEAIDSMLQACRVGPTLARVDEVSVAPGDPPVQHDFRKLPTL